MPLHDHRIRRISVSGFKSIKHCDVGFGNINVLIGSNGAGKSNFISAFSFIQSILAEELQLYVGRKGANAIIHKGPHVTDKVLMEVCWDGCTYGFGLVPSDDGRLVFETEYVGTGISENGKVFLGSGHSESLWKSGVKTPELADVMPFIEKQIWRVYHFHDTGRNAKVKQEHNISNNRALLFDAGNLAAFLYRLKQHYRRQYDEIVRTVRLIAPYFSDFVLEPKEGNEERIILRWLQRGCEDVFNASQFSDGTLRFICLTTLLLQPAELQPATIIIDEPELGLHPFAITIFAEMVRQVSEDRQIIMSTQSVTLLNEFEPNEVIVVDSGEDGSVFKRLDEKSLSVWLEQDYALGELWQKNILGGRLTR